MSGPTTLLSPKLNELLTGAVNNELAHKSYEPHEEDEQQRRILAELVSTYTIVERRIKDHTGPFDELFRNGLAQHFIKAKADVSTARTIVDWMLYEHQLKGSRQAS